MQKLNNQNFYYTLYQFSNMLQLFLNQFLICIFKLFLHGLNYLSKFFPKLKKFIGIFCISSYHHSHPKQSVKKLFKNSGMNWNWIIKISKTLCITTYKLDMLVVFFSRQFYPNLYFNLLLCGCQFWNLFKVGLVREVNILNNNSMLSVLNLLYK